VSGADSSHSEQINTKRAVQVTGFVKMLLGYVVRCHCSGAEALRHSVVKLDRAVSARASDVMFVYVARQVRNQWAEPFFSELCRHI
jgi:hypothetical protein